jgi:hypothetical protein
MKVVFKPPYDFKPELGSVHQHWGVKFTAVDMPIAKGGSVRVLAATIDDELAQQMLAADRVTQWHDPKPEARQVQARQVQASMAVAEEKK